MHTGLQARLDRLFNRHGDGRTVCVAADHGYMSDVTPNVVQLRQTTEAVIRGGVDGILMSPGQAQRLASSNVTNAAPQRRLFHQKILTADQALSLGATAITIYLFLGYDDEIEA